jgi:hypothetical protein
LQLTQPLESVLIGLSHRPRLSEPMPPPPLGSSVEEPPQLVVGRRALATRIV